MSRFKFKTSTCCLLFWLGAAVSSQAARIHHYRLDETFQHEPITDSSGSADGSSTEVAGVLSGAGGVPLMVGSAWS